MRSASLLLTTLAVCAAPLAATAQVRTFPYEAVVETDGVPVHSGPGFYVTNRLKRGDRVVVHRHDPGGWYVVAPPRGEYSLIAADAIRPADAGTAEIVANEAYTRAGSRLTGEHTVEQVPLGPGDRVRLLADVKAPAGWAAIEPVRGEFRWVPGKYLVPVEHAVRSEQDADPFAVPTAAVRPETFSEPVELSGAEAEFAAPAPVSESAPVATSAPEASQTAEALRRLDRELESLTLIEPTDWPLERLAAEYRRLKSSEPATGRQIDVRLAQIAKMQTVQDHYRDYVQLTSATDERDAALLARRRGAPARQIAQVPGPDSGGPRLNAPPQRLAAFPDQEATPLPPPAPPAESRPVVQGGPPFATEGVARPAPPRPEVTRASAEGPALLPPDSSVTPTQPPRRLTASAPPPAPAAAPPAKPPAAPTSSPVTATAAKPSSQGPQRFDAIGIIQKAVNPRPDAPRHVLVAPNGKIVLHLGEQPGIALDRFVGQAMGIDGHRLQHPGLKTPMIVVTRLTPVRL